MPLKYSYTNEADIPAESKSLFINRDGKWVLNVEGAADATQLGEFRDNNRELMRALNVSTMAEAKTKLDTLKEVDPQLYRTLKEAHDKTKDKKLIDEGKVEEVVAERTKTMKAEYDKKVEDLATQIKTLTASLEENLIVGAIATAAAAKGVRPGAIDDVKARGRSVFKIEGGKVVAYDGEGKKRFNSKGEALAVTEWMDELSTNAAHLFEPNGGGGGGGNQRGGAGGTGKNPWSRKTFNLTQQSKIQKENPTLAKQLKESAEV